MLSIKDDHNGLFINRICQKKACLLKSQKSDENLVDYLFIVRVLSQNCSRLCSCYLQKMLKVGRLKRGSILSSRLLKYLDDTANILIPRFLLA